MPEWLITLIVASIPTAGATLLFLLGRRRDKADLATTLNGLATSTAEALTSERKARRELEKRLDDEVKLRQQVEETVSGMQKALAERDDYIIQLLGGIAMLCKQLKGMKRKPCWDPEEPKFAYTADGKRVEKPGALGA